MRTETTELAEQVQPSLGDRLSNRYFLITLAVFVAVGIPAYFYLISAVEGQFVDNYSNFSVRTAQQEFTHHLQTVDDGKYTEPLEGEVLASFLEEVERQVEGADLIKVKVWRPDGMLLYSTSGVGVGESREFDHHFLEAIEDGYLSEVEQDEPEVAGEESSGQVLEIYLPIYDSEGQVTNLFEIYYSTSPLSGAITSMRTTLAGFLIALFVAVMAVGQLGSRLLVRRNKQLTSMATKLARLAETDGLTGLYNHRYFHDEMTKELDASTRYGRRLSLIMVDLDFFKRVNDTYGHQTGDVVLRETAAAMARTIRSVDTLARYGGEEFAILMPETPEREAVEAAERIAEVIREIAVSAGSERISVTASFGVAEFPTAALDTESLVSASDSALYFAKKNGRDRVSAFSALTPGSVDEADIDHLFHRLRHAGVFTVQALAAAVMGNGEELPASGGSIQLARLAGTALELPESEKEALTLAASVYDVGKLAIPDAVLGKPESLTVEEAATIKAHPEASEKILAAVGDLERILKVVRHHHEHFDGSGYPEGLKGDEIPYLARVLHVIDAYGAMTADRAYRDAMTPEDAIAELRKHSGTQFDPAIVERLALSLVGGEQKGLAA